VLDRYRDLIATYPGLELKGKSMPYTSINGHMSSFLSPDGMLHLRLSKPDKAAFMEQLNARETVQHGVVMKEYAELPEGAWNDPGIVAKYFKLSGDYVGGLKPK